MAHWWFTADPLTWSGLSVGGTVVLRFVYLCICICVFVFVYLYLCICPSPSFASFFIAFITCLVSLHFVKPWLVDNTKFSPEPLECTAG